MEFGLCPNCMNKLTEETSIVTKPSGIFKGNNVYVLCMHCQQVLLYNKDRNMIFDLEEYKEDESVIEEINLLLEELDSNFEVVSPCDGNCSQCKGHEEQEYQGYFSNKEKRQHQNEERQESIPAEAISAALDHSFLAVNKEDPAKKKIILEQDLNSIKIDEWMFFELVPVVIRAVTTYEIERQ